MTHTSTEQLQMKAERDLMVRSLDEWVMQTGAVVLNSSWHSELQSLMEMAFDKGAELQAARRAQVVPKGWKLVPKLPTREMYEETWETRQYVAFDRFIDDYEAMLAAAPQPPEAAPVQLPEYGIDTANHAGVRVRGYTEHQVRELLARK